VVKLGEMRLFALLAAVLVFGSAAAFAAPAPSYTVSFSGRGLEHHVDYQQNILDSGVCDSDEHVDLTATLAWATAWPAFRAAGPAPLARPSSIAGSQASGSQVKGPCDVPADQAPQGWIGTTTCQADLVPAGSPSLTVVGRTKTTLTLAFVAPQLSVPVGAGCSLNVRNDLLTAQVTVSLKKLAALKKGRSLALPVASAQSLDCSQATKPYEGYRTTDRCQDDLTWSGTVTVTRAS
jgi:hypothetical protein